MYRFLSSSHTKPPPLFVPNDIKGPRIDGIVHLDMIDNNNSKTQMKMIKANFSNWKITISCLLISTWTDQGLTILGVKY